LGHGYDGWVELGDMPHRLRCRRLTQALAVVAVLLLASGLLCAQAAGQEEGGAPSDDASAAACASPTTGAAPGRPAADGRPVLFDDFVQPLMDAASQRRAQVQQHDPQAQERVDADLNARRLNVALLGYGEEHDQTYADEGVSVTVLSLDLDTWQMSDISLSRDIRVPELEEAADGPPRWPMTLRAAYHERGVDGIRAILEDATGLAIDFEVLMKDVFVRNYVRDVNGPVTLVVPKVFHTNTYRLDGVDHPPDVLPAGRQVLDADRAMTFVLGEELDPQGRVDERSYRKNLLLTTLSCDVRQRIGAGDVGFLVSLARFAASEATNQDLRTDFDLQLVLGGLSHMAQTFVVGGGDVHTEFPQLGASRQLVVHDPSFGDGGVRRVHAIEADLGDPSSPDDPLVQEEVRLGSLAPYMLIPVGGNPYASDLVTGYWTSVRQLVRDTLTAGG
jgi:hypothetical protein